jgi:hypothetical protein
LLDKNGSAASALNRTGRMDDIDGIVTEKKFQETRGIGK